MTMPHPVHFCPTLTTERLATIARWLLEELHATEDDLVRDTDCAYTRGGTRFGRQKNRIVKEATSGSHAWLSLRNGGNDVVFAIDEIPCRFSNDNPESPSKDAVLLTHRYQLPLLESAADGEPGRFCFVIDRGSDEAQEPRVVFLGFSATNEVVCSWASSDIVLLTPVKPEQPAAVDVAKPQVMPKRRSDADDSTAATAGP